MDKTPRRALTDIGLITVAFLLVFFALLELLPVPNHRFHASAFLFFEWFFLIWGITSIFTIPAFLVSITEKGVANGFMTLRWEQMQSIHMRGSTKYTRKLLVRSGSEEITIWMYVFVDPSRAIDRIKESIIWFQCEGLGDTPNDWYATSNDQPNN